MLKKIKVLMVLGTLLYCGCWVSIPKNYSSDINADKLIIGKWRFRHACPGLGKKYEMYAGTIEFTENFTFTMELEGSKNVPKVITGTYELWGRGNTKNRLQILNPDYVKFSIYGLAFTSPDKMEGMMDRGISCQGGSFFFERIKETITAEINIGMTESEVINLIGKPIKKVNLGEKIIYQYPDMFITFVTGIVVNVQFK